MKNIFILIAMILLSSCTGLKNIGKYRALYVTTVIENIEYGNKKIKVQGKYKFVTKGRIEEEMYRQALMSRFCSENYKDGYTGIYNNISEKWETDENGLISVLHNFNCNGKSFLKPLL